MGKHQKTIDLIQLAAAILAQEHPMTVRQLYYQLVVRQAIENSQSAYNRVGRAMVAARLEGAVPWEHIEDRTRRPRSVSMWDDLADFGETIRRAYRRDVWNTQPALLEAWLEKDALSGIFEDVLRPYGVTLNVGKGYDGWSSIHGAAARWGAADGTDGGPAVSIIYFGDHDPSGEDMLRSLQERLAQLGSHPTFEKVAILHEDIDLYNLPPDFAKTSDTRHAGFVAEHGDATVELDALPVAILRQRLTRAVESRMDLKALAAVRRQEKRDLARLNELLAG